MRRPLAFRYVTSWSNLAQSEWFCVSEGGAGTPHISITFGLGGLLWISAWPGDKTSSQNTLFNVLKGSHPPGLHVLNYRSLYEALHCLLISHKFSTPTLTSLMKDPMCKESIHTISKHHWSLEMPKTTTPPWARTTCPSRKHGEEGPGEET